MSTDKASEAREGLLDNIAGKAKEVAGAVSGNDTMVEEGQLQQAEARNRKAAVADEAIADAKRKETAQELAETNREAAQVENAARTQADREEAVVGRQQESERAAAEREARLEEAAGREAAEERADDLAAQRLREAEGIAEDATATEQRAAAERARLEREATAADQQAARLRAETQS
jgi:uncharacterized protein YjbJ (UPF0337 family)